MASKLLTGTVCRRSPGLPHYSWPGRSGFVRHTRTWSRFLHGTCAPIALRSAASERGVWRANVTPKLKKRTALLRKLKDVFRRYQSQPVDRVITLINPVLRGWVNYRDVETESRLNH